MKYFYAYGLEKNGFQNLDVVIDKKYIDNDDDRKEWKCLLKSIKPLDTIYISSIKEFCADEKSLKVKLEELKKIQANLLNLDGEEIHVSLILDVMSFVEESQKERARLVQRAGIDKALEKKYKGEGSFGRPRIKVPEDFVDNIKRIFNKEMTHEEYRASLDMKKSTYFKLVGEIKKGLKK